MKKFIPYAGLACLLAAFVLLTLSFEMGTDPAGEELGAKISGRVTGGEPVINATIALVKASDVAKSTSIQPLEDLAATTPYKVKTDGRGSYVLDVPPGRYFVYVTPDASDTKHLPGGDMSNRSVDVTGAGLVVTNVELWSCRSGLPPRPRGSGRANASPVTWGCGRSWRRDTSTASGCPGYRASSWISPI